MKVQDLFDEMVKGDPYATKAIPGGIMCRDQYGTEVTYADAAKTLTFKYDGAEDEDAVLFGTSISAEAPITMYMSGNELTIQVPNVDSEKAADIVKKVLEV